MAKLITRIGHRDDPNRKLVVLEPRSLGSYAGHFGVLPEDYLNGRLETEDRTGSSYGNSLDEALRNSFWWAGIKLYTLFDIVEGLAKALVEGDE